MMGVAKEATITLDSIRHDLVGANTKYYNCLRMRKSIAADLAKLEQELSHKTTDYDGTPATGKTGENGMEKRNGSLNNQTETEEVEDGNVCVRAQKPAQKQEQPPAPAWITYQRRRRRVSG
ncbi:hypothetical protein PVAP13_5NG287534 [Panicum virgatum]|uniref:Uncharacterized protein n=1 Tax=Panicum virgatum TaxID=38727 RepID=A0A8T0RX76_PANVG|nr:hypothetical protein PVAP13_5NG287534 [Panicum virgatum]